MTEFVEMKADGLDEGDKRFIRTTTKELKTIMEALGMSPVELTERQIANRQRKARKILENINAF